MRLRELSVSHTRSRETEMGVCSYGPLVLVHTHTYEHTHYANQTSTSMVDGSPRPNRTMRHHQVPPGATPEQFNFNFNSSCRLWSRRDTSHTETRACLIWKTKCFLQTARNINRSPGSAMNLRSQYVSSGRSLTVSTPRSQRAVA